MTKIAGSRSESGSGSISQMHGSMDTDPHQMSWPEHWVLPAFSAATEGGEGSQHPVWVNVKAAFLHSSKDMLITQQRSRYLTLQNIVINVK